MDTKDVVESLTKQKDAIAVLAKEKKDLSDTDREVLMMHASLYLGYDSTKEIDSKEDCGKDIIYDLCKVSQMLIKATFGTESVFDTIPQVT
jgi:hypothetical protein